MEKRSDQKSSEGLLLPLPEVESATQEKVSLQEISDELHIKLQHPEESFKSKEEFGAYLQKQSDYVVKIIAAALEKQKVQLTNITRVQQFFKYLLQKQTNTPN